MNSMGYKETTKKKVLEVIIILSKILSNIYLIENKENKNKKM